MHPVDVFLTPLIPILILTHLLVAPYTKVEESFNVQATHDIANYGVPIQEIYNQLALKYDHFSFPGAVPRTFVGALALAGITKPYIGLFGSEYSQFIIRATLGLFNAYALLRYKNGLDRAFGKDVGRWYILLQAAQFHVIFYASRTLPNMFAFGLTTIALGEFLPAVRPLLKVQITKRQRLAIFLLVFSGVVFRSEIAVLLFTQLLALLVESRISLQTIIPAGIGSALVALAISVPIDSYFWQKPIWPELAGFYYNAILGKSAEWGVSPYAHYFSTLLPRLLLNPLILTLLIPTSFMLPSTKYQSRDLVIPSILFIASYSLQPHKESRFIIYVVPPLTAAASLSASYIWTRRSKTLLYRAGSLLLVVSILGSFAASTGMLLISSLNYPGGEALSKLHAIIRKTEWPETPQNSPMNISVHVDVLSCMTGVTRFQEIPWRDLQDDELPIINERRTRIAYDKTEDEEELLVPEFWEKFDYSLMEEPGKAIGKWEVVDTVYAYAGIEFLRPGDGSSFGENMERVYAANNITKEEDGREKVPGSEDIKEVVEGVAELDSAKNDMGELKTKLLLEELGKFGTYKLVRDAVRQVTGGWWIGPRMAPRIRILKKVRGPLPE